MKIVSIQGQEITVIPDTALLRNNDPFYAPDFASGGIQDVAGVSAKITRIVKCIDEKFAHRAWDEWIECTHHRALGIQSGIGLAYDRSFEVGIEIHPKSELSTTDQQLLDRAIAYASTYISLRIGDYVFLAR